MSPSVFHIFFLSVNQTNRVLYYFRDKGQWCPKVTRGDSYYETQTKFPLY